MCNSPLCGWALRAQRIASDLSLEFHWALIWLRCHESRKTSPQREAIIFTQGASEASPALCHSNLWVMQLFLIWMQLTSPAPGQRNRPLPSQLDFSCSVENHFILFSGVWWIELPARRKRETRTAVLVSFYVATGRFYAHCIGWAGWSEQPHGGRAWWVISWICSADWICFGLDRARVWTVCCKEQCCQGWRSLAGSLPSVPGHLAMEFLLVISTGTGQFSSSLL